MDKSRQERAHRWPCFLPDVERFVYHAYSPQTQVGSIRVGSLDRGEKTWLFDNDSNAIYVSPHGRKEPGYLLYVRDESLMARRFDADANLKSPVEAVRVSGNDRVAAVGGSFRGLFSASDNGLLVFYSNGDGHVVKFNRNGRDRVEIGDPAPYNAIRLSPDGRKVAYLARRKSTDMSDNKSVWLLNLNSGRQDKHASVREPVHLPIFSGNDAVIFAAGAMGRNTEVYRSTLSTGKTDLLFDASANLAPLDVSRNGRFVLLLKDAHKQTPHLAYARLTGGTQETPEEFQEIDSNRGEIRFSPDGRWVAYTSTDEWGKDWICYRAFPPSGPEYRIEEGNHPVWGESGEGKEIVFLAPGRRLKSAALVEVGSKLELKGEPLVLFTLSSSETGVTDGTFQAWPWWDMTSDGKFFYVLVREKTSMTVVEGWTAALSG
jgi:hypothetical protein